ncbi:Leucine-Rich Repeat-Containing Protein 10B, partial [Manis pentadactyla]
IHTHKNPLMGLQHSLVLDKEHRENYPPEYQYPLLLAFGSDASPATFPPPVPSTE